MQILFKLTEAPTKLQNVFLCYKMHFEPQVVSIIPNNNELKKHVTS